MSISIFAWLGALAIGLSLGLLGSGGSILTVPVLIYFFDQPEKLAIAGSLAIVGLIALFGSLSYIRKGLIDWRSVLLFGIPGMIGTYGGAYISQFISGILQLSLFAFVMLAAALFMLKPSASQADIPQRQNYKIIIDGLIVGVVTGLVGVGGGFLIVPALVLMGGLTMHVAIGTSLCIIALKSSSGFYKYIQVLEQQNLTLDWQIIGFVTLVGIVGSLIGNMVSSRLPQARLKRYFAYFLFPMATWILVKNLPVLLT